MTLVIYYIYNVDAAALDFIWGYPPFKLFFFKDEPIQNLLP